MSQKWLVSSPTIKSVIRGQGIGKAGAAGAAGAAGEEKIFTCHLSPVTCYLSPAS
jgi:predicted GNAT family acetyltransferase